MTTTIIPSRAQQMARLSLIADKLETVPDEKFNFRYYQSACGTVACAMGWACEIPALKDLGLRMGSASPESASGEPFEDWVERELGLEMHKYEYLFIPNDQWSEDTCAELDVEIGNEEKGCSVFAPRQDLIDHIRMFVKHNGVYE